ncbi:NHL domain-containing protein [Abeliophyllum distichum]|uniref:NHL domain-containing protein n=1 Tax=Abeliophyllum distichum TaxID=126358 RepID=A0ABD1RB19_9LAMI
MFKPILVFLAFIVLVGPTTCRKRHVINFRWHNLYPESFIWDPKSEHFVVGSLRQQTLISVSDAGVTSSLLSDASLPSNSSFLGLALDRRHHRLLAVVHRPSTLTTPAFNALASYHLSTFDQLFLTPLPPTTLPFTTVANDVAVDFSGNAYVTDSANDAIYKINIEGQASILSKSQAFKSHPVDNTAPYQNCGLNGVVYNSKGYLLVTQSNTGKLFKVNADDGTARSVILNRDLTAADGIAVRSDGVVVVVSQYKLYFIKSDDSWSEGVVFDETALEDERQASAVVVGASANDRVYVLYGHVNEGTMGNAEREEFSIVEVESEKESKEENVWIFVLIGLGLAYFLFWRFQMRQLMQNMNKKTA